MPSIVGEEKIKERFDNGGGEMEHIFREKFLQNLNVSFSTQNLYLFVALFHKFNDNFYHNVLIKCKTLQTTKNYPTKVIYPYLISMILLNTSQFVENLVRAWRDDNLDLETFGINGNLIAEAKNDGGDILDNFIAGEPASFQKELLQGIGFLQERIQRSESDPDAITVVRKFSCNGRLISNLVKNPFEPFINFLNVSI